MCGRVCVCAALHHRRAAAVCVRGGCMSVCGRVWACVPPFTDVQLRYARHALLAGCFSRAPLPLTGLFIGAFLLLVGLFRRALLPLAGSLAGLGLVGGRVEAGYATPRGDERWKLGMLHQGVLKGPCSALK